MPPTERFGVAGGSALKRWASGRGRSGRLDRRWMAFGDLEDGKYGIGAHPPEEMRCRWRLRAGPHRVQGRAVPPQRLNAPMPILAAEEFGTEQAIRHRLDQQITKAGQQGGFAFDRHHRADL